MKEVSRQRKFQKQRLAAGLCYQCGDPREHYTERCDACQAKVNARQRRDNGWNPWKPGGRGRPPKVR